MLHILNITDMKKQISIAGINSVYLTLLLFAFLSIFTSCKKEKNDPVVETTSLIGVTMREYTATATLIDRGDYKILDHGFVYTLGRTESEVSYYNANKVSLGDTIMNNTFKATFDVGDISSYYYNDYKCFVKAYITNEKGTIFGKLVSTDLLVLKIKSVVPSSGSYGDTVTINGNYFNEAPFFNQVYFDNTIAQVLSATTKTLRVIVPQISSYYSDDYVTIKVVAEGKEVSLQDAFHIEASVVNFAPYSGSWNTNITIYGAGLYNASLYFDNLFITYNNYNSTSISASIPYNIGKKQFKIFVHKDGKILEVPGGYFVLNDFVVSPLNSTTFYAGSIINFNGQMFNPQNSMNKLMLGNTTITAYDGYSSYAYFAIPNSMPPGSYQPSLTNGIDTVTLNQTIQIQ
jgi:hypothetical protein